MPARGAGNFRRSGIRGYGRRMIEPGDEQAEAEPRGWQRQYKDERVRERIRKREEKKSRKGAPGTENVRWDSCGRDLDKRNAKQREQYRWRSNPHVVKLDKEHNPGGAVWCEQHKTLECKGIKKRSRERCHSTAIRGTANCNIHAGQTTEKAIAMGEARISAWQALGAPPVGGSVDPGQAVMAVLDMTWQRTAIYGDLLRKQFEKGRQQAEQATGLSADQLADSGGATSGLIGQKMSAAPGTGEIYATGEEIRALVELEGRERDRVMKYAEVAHKMGIQDRMASLAERWGDVVAGRVMAVLGELNLTPEQEHAVEGAIARHLSSIDMNAIEGTVVE